MQGDGTTVRIFLHRPGASPQSVTQAHPLVETLGGTETILLVEDEPALRSLAERVLNEASYTVLVADTPDMTERLFEKHREDTELLLTDVVLHGCSGLQLYETLSGRKPALPVLYMSGYTDDAMIRHGVLEEGTTFMQKPFTPAELCAKLREALASGGHDESS